MKHYKSQCAYCLLKLFNDNWEYKAYSVTNHIHRKPKYSIIKAKANFRVNFCVKAHRRELGLKSGGGAPMVKIKDFTLASKNRGGARAPPPPPCPMELPPMLKHQNDLMKWSQRHASSAVIKRKLKENSATTHKETGWVVKENWLLENRKKEVRILCSFVVILKW